jgi:hypothetical protein
LSSSRGGNNLALLLADPLESAAANELFIEVTVKPLGDPASGLAKCFKGGDDFSGGKLVHSKNP